MFFDRPQMKYTAKTELKDKWRNVIIPAIIFLLAIAFSAITKSARIQTSNGYITYRTTTWYASLIGAFILPIISVGFTRYIMNIMDRKAYDKMDVFYGFGNYGSIFLSMLWVSIFTVLWSMLFLVPGIIKALAYSQTKYILAENPKVGYREAIKISMVLTDGRKGDIFKLTLSFIGWYFVLGVTCGIAGLYVLPYSEATFVQAYEMLKAAAIEEGRITADVFNPDGSYSVQ